MSRRKKGAYSPLKRPNYWQTGDYNISLYEVLRDDIMNLALSRFRYIGLPETCDARYLEWCLITYGRACIGFPKGKPGMWMSLQAVQQGQPNVYTYPARWRTQGANGDGKWQFAMDWSNGVFIFDNMSRFPLITKINIWARELADILQTQQMNRFHQRIPFILTGPNDREFDMTNLMGQITEGQLATITTDSISGIETKVFNTGVSYLGAELDQTYENTWNKIYRELGIRALPFKSERRIEDEITDTMEPTDLARLSPLSCRRQALDKLNNRFGRYLDESIKVVWNKDIESDNFNVTNDYASMLDAKRGTYDD